MRENIVRNRVVVFRTVEGSMRCLASRAPTVVELVADQARMDVVRFRELFIAH